MGMCVGVGEGKVGSPLLTLENINKQDGFSQLAAGPGWGKERGGRRMPDLSICPSIPSLFPAWNFKSSSPSFPSRCYSQLRGPTISRLSWVTGGCRPPWSEPLMLPFLTCFFGVDLPGLCCSPGLPVTNFPWLYLWPVSSLLLNSLFWPVSLGLSCCYTPISAPSWPALSCKLSPPDLLHLDLCPLPPGQERHCHLCSLNIWSFEQ